eukprot:CAMPEP_0116132942 /NCGR_PEP_ID=MMETSP0329-20121206/9833_1 /TAXON_ID=697910 /ORGANISM="Pseudo-nitzschia arenysensis, Strain B593" /LENGTH=871 /DNA_ID=CAMNT_0003627523 /DNA_START=262 /DNA_END=2877 /DNA_ORIENTATION=+
MSDSTLDELGLFCADRIPGLGEEMEPELSPPASPTSSPLMGWNFGLSPVGTDLFPADPRYSSARNESNIVNAVHMHVQENARIPNYNHPVDRSNSAKSRSKHGIDIRLSTRPEQQDNSMAELFLSSESSSRRSLNQAYEVLGSLTTEDSLQKEIDGLATVSVDPTPWSEIQNKMDIEAERKQQTQNPVPQQPPTQQKSAPTPAPVPANHPHQSSYYPYGRHHQLPIPEQSPKPQISEQSPTGSAAGQQAPTMAEVLATAAAIAAGTSGTSTTIVDNNRNIPRAKQSTTTNGVAPKPPIPYMPQSEQSNGKPPNSRPQPISAKVSTLNRHLQRQRSNANPPPHSAAHAVSRASVLAATNRKSQYGFGGNHIVPSVPAPPSIRSSNQFILKQRTVRKNNNNNKPATKKETAATTTTKKHTAVPKIPMPPTNGRHLALPIETNTGSAYERKKQKAKDARVKLNESIERLAIAVSLAGSQSKHRIDQLENQITTTEFRQKSIAVNSEGIKLAENAKKWDRPSFVGTAASVIQSLNAQCEALMAELLAINQMLENSQKSQSIASENSTNGEASNSTTDLVNGRASPHAQKRQQGADDAVDSPNKRQRIEETQTLYTHDEDVLGSVAQMLDPLSLCRCSCTAKIWRDMKAFKDEKIWLNLAVKRFGVYNVRKWSENLKEDEETEEISNKHLYEEMNASNVMPHFSQEGLSFLGNGRIQGKLSGWVFVVQRSNGETLRSVKRIPGEGVGYHSRPVVEIRIVVQNTGMGTQPVVLKAQRMGVDVSTRRRGGEFEEIYWDDRFKNVVRNLDGTIRNPPNEEDLCHLKLFETAVIEVHINARGCSTISKFRQRSNFTKVLAALDGTTVPMVIPFLKHDGMF